MANKSDSVLMRWLPHCMRDKDAIRCFSAGATSYSKRLARQMLCYKRKVKNKTNTQQLENKFVVQTLTNDDCFDWNLAKRYMHSGIQRNYCHIPEQNPAATNCVWNTLCLSHQQTSTYRNWSYTKQPRTPYSLKGKGILCYMLQRPLCLASQ